MAWSWLDGITGRGSTTTLVYDPILQTNVPRYPSHSPRASSSMGAETNDMPSLVLTGVGIALAMGATAAACYGAWRYYRHRTFLLNYGRDMTAAGAEVDPVVGRDDEIDRVVHILCNRTKNCAALVGAPGVGKTAIAEGLAQRIATGKVPPQLAGVRLLEVDLTAMVAGTQWRGMFEERIKSVIKSAEASKGKIILFFDEMHMLIGAGDNTGRSDAANILKPALARGRIRCIGATTYDEYRKHIETDPALERRFQKVHVEQPSAPATIAILQGLNERSQRHYGVEIQDTAIEAAVHLADRYITGRQFPDKAIDLINEACTSVQGKAGAIIVGPDHVAQVVSRCTGIPIAKLDEKEKVKLMHLADRLHKRVVGQNEAVELVAEAVLRSRAGIALPDQPIGSFLFLGTSGVGKTELAKALAEQLFGSEKMLVRLDMSEYSCRSSLTRLIGAPPSYIGHKDGGQLTDKVRKRPYSVILFDEVEKADHSVLNVFLQLLDDGVLTDGLGRNVDFKNTVVIMTSNLGAEHLIGGNTMKVAHGLVMKQVQKYFRPELLNRLSEVVIFQPLSQKQLKEIVNIHMKSVVDRVASKGISLVLREAVLDVILSESYNPMYGARPMKRWVEKHIVTTISKMMVNGEAGEGSTISVDAADDAKLLKYQVEKERIVADPQG